MRDERRRSHEPEAAEEPVRLGDLLIQAGRLTEAQLKEALALQKRSGERLGSALVRAGYINEAELVAGLSGEAATEKDLEIDPELVKLLPDDFVKRFEAVPVGLHENGLTIATSTPNNLTLLDEVRFVTGIHQVRARSSLASWRSDGSSGRPHRARVHRRDPALPREHAAHRLR